MDISVNWLRALAPTIRGTADELAAALSARAVPVDRTEHVGEGLEDVVVARVVQVGRHPNADRLSLCQVDVGTDDLLDVVCGAPVVIEGALYPFIPAGGTLPGGFRIERREIRGQVSNGMLCSEKELGLGRDASGIMLLADDHVVGESFPKALGLPDARLEVDLTPNRVDLACHAGVARELAPGGVNDVSLPPFGGPSWSPEWVSGESSASAGGVRVTIEDADRCFRYLAAIVRGVTIGPSPEWLQARLRAAGSRPINNVVDATNYVLLELNQPLHAFDLERLEGPEIRVRAARGESLVTLDGGEHELGPGVSVIADSSRPVALAGVMGGSDSEVSAATTDLLIECAAFDPRHTRHTAQETGLATDASYRFERGIDEAALEAAIVRCVELILATAGGEADERAIRVGRAPSPASRVALRPSRVLAVLGLRLTAEQIAGLLQPLGFKVQLGGGSDARAPLQVTVPPWRTDVRTEVDLLEEVARRYGYESFPHEARCFRPSAVPDDGAWQRTDRVRQSLTALGALEARSSSFVAGGRTTGRPARLLKPLSEAESYLRTDLVPVLLGRVEHNWTRGRRDVRLFEVGSVFQAGGAATDDGDPATPAVSEEVRVAFVVTGLRRPPHWSEAPGDFEFWDLKGWVSTLADELGLGQVGPGDPAEDRGDLAIGWGWWLGDERVCILRNGSPIGIAGRVRKEAVDSPVWAAPVYAAEFRLASVELGDRRSYAELPAYPAVSRDVALILDRGVAAASVADAIRSAGPDTLESVTPFDVYEGEGVGDGKRSLAWRLLFRAPDRTLRDEEVEEAMSSITLKLKERFDARIRSS